MDPAMDGKPSSDVLFEIEITIYVILFSAGMLVWDTVSHLGDDYRMLVKYRWHLKSPMLVYISSRLSAIGMLATALIMGPARTEIDCHLAGIFLEFFFFVVISTTLGLFALRVRAVYTGHPLIQSIFLVLWLVTAGSCLLAFFVLDSTSNPDKGVSSCLLVEKRFTLGLIIAVSAMLHDTAVFLAISYQMYRYFRLSQLASGASRSTRAVKFFIPGSRDLPPLMRALVHEGQLYYLISLSWETLVVILLIIPGIGPYYRCFMLPAHLVIVNSIACLVFRNVRLGKFGDKISYKTNRDNSSTNRADIDIEQSNASDSGVFSPNNDMNSKNRDPTHPGSFEWTIDVGSLQTAGTNSTQTETHQKSAGSLGE